MSFWKKLCYLLISVVLVCSCLCAVSYRGTSLETLTEPSLSELDLSETVGYEVEDLGDAIRFTPTAEGAVFKLRGNEAWEGFVVLELPEAKRDATPRTATPAVHCVRVAVAPKPNPDN